MKNNRNWKSFTHLVNIVFEFQIFSFSVSKTFYFDQHLCPMMTPLCSVFSMKNLWSAAETEVWSKHLGEVPLCQTGSEQFCSRPVLIGPLGPELWRWTSLWSDSLNSRVMTFCPASPALTWLISVSWDRIICWPAAVYTRPPFLLALLLFLPPSSPQQLSLNLFTLGWFIL